MIASPLWRKIFRFALVGGAATVVHAAVALLLHYQAGIEALAANVVAFFMAWGVSYLANWAWTFEAASEHRQSIPRFLTVSLSGFGLNQTLLWLTYSVLGWPMWLALAPSLVAIPAASFVASYLWAFASSPELQEAKT